ncbi:hypothetical protein VKT23_019338 [Stygiomarasmius scandens]|uniref:G-protein coupled receptors family 2 profile 2 domain-containing protein n=1 Tax=Marasmiellus scandens TaxID=2682957 RepID=A0ABR1IP18_9AGAR
MLSSSTLPHKRELPNITIVHAFIGLQLTGGIGMVLLLLTTWVFRSISKRKKTWYSFCISWIISCLSYCLLFFGGEQTIFDQEVPTYRLCLAQAALVYSGPPLTGATTFALFLEVSWSVNAVLSGTLSANKSALVYHSLYIIPYCLWVVLTVSFLIYGHTFPATVQRDTANTYCVLNSTVPPILTSALVVVAALLVLITLGMLIFHLKKSQADQLRVLRSNYLKAFLIRLVIFVGFGVVAICIGIVYTFNRTPGPEYDLAMAALPVGGFIVFGTQKDIMKEWIKIFRRIQHYLPTSKKTKEFGILLQKRDRNGNEHGIASQEVLISNLSSEIV